MGVPQRVVKLGGHLPQNHHGADTEHSEETNENNQIKLSILLYGVHAI